MTHPRENTGIPGPAPTDHAQPDSTQIVEPEFQSQPELQANSTANSEAPITSLDPAANPETSSEASPQARQARVMHYHEPQGIQFYLSVLVIVLYMTTFVVQAIRIP